MRNLIRRLRERLLGRLGRGATVDPSTQVLGWKNVRIGENSCISEHCCININDRENGLAFEVGRHVFIGRRCFFSTGKKISISDYCLIGVDCHLLGAGHHMSDPLKPYLDAGILSYGSIELGNNVWLSNQVTVIGNIKIGFGSILAARSMLLKSLPPLTMAAGNPAKIIKIFDLSKKEWIAVDESAPDFELTLKKHKDSLMSEEDYLATLRKRSPYPPMPHIAAGFRAGEI